MVERYFIDRQQHDALIRATRYGKDCQVLNKSDRIMCEIAEDDLNDVTKVFSSRHYNDERPAIVTFHFAELQIPALERAWGLLMLEHSIFDSCAAKYVECEDQLLIIDIDKLL